MDPLTMSALISGGSALLSHFMNPGKDYKKAHKELEKYYKEGQGYLQPYNEYGHEAYGHLHGAMENMLNPSSLHDQFLNNYKMSDAAKFTRDRAGTEGSWAANALGLNGSTAGTQAIQAGTNAIGAEDQLNYIKQMIDMYTKGADVAQNIYGTGANTAANMSNNALNMGNNAADLIYGKGAANNNLFGSLVGAGANVAGGYYGMKGMNNVADAWKTRPGSNGPIPSYNPMGGGNRVGGY